VVTELPFLLLSSSLAPQIISLYIYILDLATIGGPTIKKWYSGILFTVKYSPVICGQLDTSVMALGLLGVWRATQLDYISNDACAAEEMSNEEQQFQPEVHNFCITEISCSKQ
jgi:hypothetical protein